MQMPREGRGWQECLGLAGEWGKQKICALMEGATQLSSENGLRKCEAMLPEPSLCFCL